MMTATSINDRCKVWEARSKLSLPLLMAGLGILLSGAVGGMLRGEVVLNEAMANEPGSDVALEWAELYNAGEDTASLACYLFVEAGDTTRFSDTLQLPPGGYLVLSRRPVSESGESSFERFWGDASGVWGDSPGEEFPLVAAKFSLRNSDDRVWLVDVTTAAVDSIFWTSSAPDGVSCERVNPFKPPRAGNFALCVDASGSTPGRANSVLPPAHDLGLDAEGTTIDVESDGKILLHAAVANLGLEVSTATTMLICFDRDFSGKPSESDDCDTVIIPELLPDSIYHFEREYFEMPGRKVLLLRLPDDGALSNNQMQQEFSVGDAFLEVAINEFLANPTEALGSEWIELVNLANYDIDLNGFLIGTLDQAASIDSGILLGPDERMLVVENAKDFAAFSGLRGCPTLQLDDWVSLADDSGHIMVINDFGLISDSLTYASTWPGNTSWERYADSSGVGRPSIFYRSTSVDGSTPCEANSTPPVLPQYDLGFVSDSLGIVKPADAGEPVVLSTDICNHGISTSPVYEIVIYLDRDYDLIPEEDELLARESFRGLEPGECRSAEFEILLTAGRQRLIACLPADDVTANNCASSCFSLGPKTREIVITEFLADPEDDLECEWVECKSASNRSIDLGGWSFGDGVRLHELPGAVAIGSLEYFIIAEDSAEFARYYGAGCTIVEPAAWSNLNNSGDCIRLIDDFGVLSDSVKYDAVNGDNRSLELNEVTAGEIEGEEAWYPSTSQFFSTPCEINSVSAEPSPEIEIVLYNRVFAPSGGEVLQYSLKLPPATALTIEIFDLAGRRHFTIADELPMSTGEYSYAGESDYYDRLPAGAYIMKVEANDGSGYSARMVFAVAASQ